MLDKYLASWFQSASHGDGTSLTPNMFLLFTLMPPHLEPFYAFVASGLNYPSAANGSNVCIVVI